MRVFLHNGSYTADHFTEAQWPRQCKPSLFPFTQPAGSMYLRPGRILQTSHSQEHQPALNLGVVGSVGQQLVSRVGVATVVVTKLPKVKFKGTGQEAQRIACHLIKLPAGQRGGLLDKVTKTCDVYR